MSLFEAGHLGGYIEGGDPDTFYPTLWMWLVEVYGIRSVIDVGCGEGASVDYFKNLLGPAGFPETALPNVLGVDGVPQSNPLIVTHDFTTGPFEPLGRFDLCWSCEFVEHIDEEYVGNFLETFQAADVVLMSHALPEQPGYHHVNCREPEYWIEKLALAGYVLDAGLTQTTRALAHTYYARTGLAFRRP